MTENTTQPQDPTRVKLALKAADIITGDRQTDYGPPEVNFQRIANLWNDHMETDIFTPRKVAELMLLLKIARTVNSPTEDSYVDLIGYAALAGEMAETERKNGETPIRYTELATKRDLEELKKQIIQANEIHINHATKDEVVQAKQAAEMAQSLASAAMNHGAVKG